MQLDSTRSLLIRLFALAFLVLVPPVAWISVQALDNFEAGMTPEMDKKAATVGRDLAAQVERAVGLGIPLDRLVGVDDFFAPVLEANPEIRYLAVSDRLGHVLFLKGAEASVLEPYYRSADFEGAGAGRKASIDAYLDLALPLTAKGGRVGQVHVGFDADYVRGQLVTILYDIVVVLAVSLLVAFELLLFVVSFNISAPMKLVTHVMDRVRRGDFTHQAEVGSRDEVGRFVRSFNAAIRRADELYRRLSAYVDEVKGAHFDKTVVERVADIEARVKFLFRFSGTGAPEIMHERRATDVRLPLFFFVFAEEISRSFMPIYAAGLYTESFHGLSRDLVAAVPIAVFMACIALASPWAGMISDRVGSRRVFMLGLIPAVLGYVLSAFAQGIFDLLLWRAASGIGYALVTMACQSYISRSLKDDSRAQGLGVYVGAVLSASICGNAIGGVLAERVGMNAAFVVSAGMAMLSGVLVYRLLEAVDERRELREPTGGDLWGLLRNWRFTFLVLFAAIPSKMALTGFVFFLAPLHLHQTGFDFAAIARILVLYSAGVVVLSPLASRIADKFGFRSGLVAVGGLIGGAGMVAPVLLPGDLPIILGVALLGVSHGLSASPQLALVPDVCWIECRAMGRTNVLALMRLLERVGSVAGPILAASFIPFWGYSGAIVALGVVVLAMAVVFAVVSGAYGSGPHIQTEEAA